MHKNIKAPNFTKVTRGVLLIHMIETWLKLDDVSDYFFYFK